MKNSQKKSLDNDFQLIKGKEKIAEIIYMIGLSIEVLVLCIDNASAWTTPFRGRLVQAAFVLFVIKIICTKYKIKEWITIIVLMLIGSVSYLTCTEEMAIRAIVFVVAAKGVDVKKIVKFMFTAILASTILIACLSIVGVSGRAYEVRHFGRGTEELRFVFGFNHANNFHDVFWMITMLFLVLRGKKYRFFEMISLSAVNICLFLMTRSRTGVIVAEMIIVGYWISWLWNNKIFSVVIHYSLLLFLVVSMWVTLWCARYQAIWKSYLRKIDSYLTGRLELVSERAQLLEWRLFPKGFKSPDIDNGFAYIGYSYGYIILGILLCAILWLSFKMYRSKFAGQEILLFSAVLVVFMESTFIFNVSMACDVVLVLLIIYGVNSGIQQNDCTI